MIITAKLLPKVEDSKHSIKLSVSKAKTFDDCKAKYKFCYTDKLPRVEQDFHVFGSFLHFALEVFHRKLLNNPALKDNWKPSFQEAWDEAYTEFSSKVTGLQVKEGLKIYNEYKTILEEEGLPNVIAVEQNFLININDKVLLNGFIDRVQLDDDGLIHVADYKTTKDPKYLKDYFQLLTYCYAIMLQDESLKRIRGSFILLKHNYNYLTHEFVRDEVITVAEKFLKYAFSIEEEKAWRPNPQFLCKYCDYLNHCKSGEDFLVKKGVIKKQPFVGIRKW
ncbi:MAG: PD-(D/E)XK nuclease family protein [Clostridia bacterium]|jgi:RecB family exonuclease